jgi:AmmeMemoRadiSam system protein B
MNVIRQPAVAGSFYPGAARALGDAVASLLAVEPGYEGPPPKALIVPHAGYIYSGPTAAAGYARLRPFRERYRRVVLLGPCHRVPVRGLAASGAAAFRTPLGDVPVDIGGLAALGLPTVEAAHRDEHSLEVHLPFLQTVLASFTLVPLVVGDASDAEVADVLEQLWDGPETLIVVSSDLSHYLAYAAACVRDARTCDAIKAFAADRIDHGDACGATPVRGLLFAARRHGLQVTTVDLRNSGDTAGDRQQVVGYGAWSFTEQAGVGRD